MCCMGQGGADRRGICGVLQRLRLRAIHRQSLKPACHSRSNLSHCVYTRRQRSGNLTPRKSACLRISARVSCRAATRRSRAECYSIGNPTLLKATTPGECLHDPVRSKHYFCALEMIWSLRSLHSASLAFCIASGSADRADPRLGSSKRLHSY